MKIGEKAYKLILWLIVVILCAIGYILQVNHISRRYFNYNTRTIVNMIIPTRLSHFPSVSTCWSVVAMVNRTQIAAEKRINNYDKFKRANIDGDIFYRKIKELTIKELFKYTPNIDNILSSNHKNINNTSIACQVRKSLEYSVQKSSVEKCMDFFHIHKYFEREYVCYEFIMKLTETLNMVRYAMSPSYTGEIFRLYLDKEIFKEIGAISCSVHTSESSRLFDSVFASNHFQIGDKYPALKVTYREINIEMMKSPYDTHCDELPGNYTTGQEYSLNKVNEVLLKELNVITPFVPVYNHSLTYRMLHDLDFKEKKFKGKVNGLSKKFGNLKGCITKFVDTTADLLDESTPYVAIYWPQDEELSIKYVPDQELIDFIVYITSCIGVWFGLSAYSVHDGINFILDMRKRIRKDGKIIQNSGKHYGILALNRRIDNLYRVVGKNVIQASNMHMTNEIQYLRHRIHRIENRIMHIMNLKNREA